MFDILFGWRKASKCKKLIKQVQCRLKLLKNKRCAIAKQLREDIVQLIKTGYHQTAFNRVEQIMKDETTMEAYELLGNFCEFILANLSYIRKHKDCPNDVNEAVSSLIYASARCGDLPELQLIRKLFGERYGPGFEKTAVELCPGNLVNPEIKEKISTKTVSDDEKNRMIQKIVRDCLQPELLALEYRSDWHQNQETHTYQDITDRPKKQVVESCAVSLENEEGRKNSASSCESLPQLPDEKIVYLDDVVELTREGDQRLFKFRTAAVSKRESIVNESYDQTDMDRSEYWSDTENSSSKNSRKGRSGSVKGSRSRFMSKEMKRPKDIEYVSYYSRPFDTSTHKHQMRHQKNIMADEKACYLEVKGNFCRHVPKRGISPLKEFSTHGVVQEDQKGEFFPVENVRIGVSDKEMEWASFYKKQRRMRRRRGSLNCDIKSAAYDVFTYPKHDSNARNKEITEGNAKYKTVENRENLQVSNEMMNKTQSPYMRAVTMPTERPKDGEKTNFSRTNSCPYRHPNHVHPKLPDYEDIAAKFMALKRKHVQNNSLKS